MRPAVRDELLRVNRAFYQNLALSFAATRPRPQPGVVHALAAIPPQASVLDVGCGHGLSAVELARRGHRGPYLGLDSSERLIEMARQRLGSPRARFHQVDLADPDWRSELAAGGHGPFDRGLAFAVLHHLPGDHLRLRVVNGLRDLLTPAGRAAVSVWDIPQTDRLRQRLVPWRTIGLDEADVDPGDVLVDWRHEGRGVRYVHRFTSEELADLGSRCGFQVLEEYRSDGQGGRMGLYQIWSPRRTT